MKKLKLLLVITFFIINKANAAPYGQTLSKKNSDSIHYISLSNMAGDFDSILVIRATISISMNQKNFKIFKSATDYNQLEDFFEHFDTISKKNFLFYIDSILNKSDIKNTVIRKVENWCLNYSVLTSITKFIDAHNGYYNLATLINKIPEMRFLLKKYIGKNQYWGSLDSSSLSNLFHDILNYLCTLTLNQQLELNAKMLISITKLK